MTRNIKFFLIVFFLSLPFWWGINVLQKGLEDFFYSLEIKKNPPRVFTTQIVQTNNLKDKNSENFNLGAKSAISVEVDKEGKEKVLFSRAENQKMQIASLTKLMTAVIAVESYDPSLKVRVSRSAVNQEGKDGNLRVGEILNAQELLRIMLIESSNDAAFALAEVIREKKFVDLMNLKAKEMGLRSTRFFNPTGLDPNKPTEPANYSTARDLVKLAEYLLKKHPEILEITTKKQYKLCPENGISHPIIKNTDELLGKIPGIIGGKTGYTKRAGGCLILILESRRQGNYLINVVLNSSRKFQDMKKLCLRYR